MRGATTGPCTVQAGRCLLPSVFLGAFLRRHLNDPPPKKQCHGSSKRPSGFVCLKAKWPLAFGGVFDVRPVRGAKRLFWSIFILAFCVPQGKPANRPFARLLWASEPRVASNYWGISARALLEHCELLATLHGRHLRRQKLHSPLGLCTLS